jgi:hypothetical protein
LASFARITVDSPALLVARPALTGFVPLWWFEKPPIPGTRLHSHRSAYHDGRWYTGQTWVVDEVRHSDDTPTVFCVGRSEYLDKRRRSSDGRLDLADELLDLARHTRETLSERRRRWKHRNYRA